MNEKIAKVNAWLQRMVADRVKDPSLINPREVHKAAVLIDEYVRKHGPSERTDGFLDGVLLSLIVFNTSPDNVKGVRNEGEV